MSYADAIGAMVALKSQGGAIALPAIGAIAPSPARSVNLRVENFAPQVKDRMMGFLLLVKANHALQKAVGELKRFGFFDKWSGHHKAQIDRIASILRFLKSVSDSLSGQPKDTISHQDQRRVALVLVQSSDVLRSVRDAASKSEVEHSIEGVIHEFAAAIKKVLTEYVKPIIEAAVE